MIILLSSTCFTNKYFCQKLSAWFSCQKNEEKKPKGVKSAAVPTVVINIVTKIAIRAQKRVTI